MTVTQWLPRNSPNPQVRISRYHGFLTVKSPVSYESALGPQYSIPIRFQFEIIDAPCETRTWEGQGPQGYIFLR